MLRKLSCLFRKVPPEEELPISRQVSIRTKDTVVENKELQERMFILRQLTEAVKRDMSNCSVDEEKTSKNSKD